jgi:hypothetical protein
MSPTWSMLSWFQVLWPYKKSPPLDSHYYLLAGYTVFVLCWFLTFNGYSKTFGAVFCWRTLPTSIHTQVFSCQNVGSHGFVAEDSHVLGWYGGLTSSYCHFVGSLFLLCTVRYTSNDTASYPEWNESSDPGAIVKFTLKGLCLMTWTLWINHYQVHKKGLQAVSFVFLRVDE